jgi:hypothetical protein
MIQDHSFIEPDDDLERVYDISITHEPSILRDEGPAVKFPPRNISGTPGEALILIHKGWVWL